MPDGDLLVRELAHARDEDDADPLGSFRAEFTLPTNRAVGASDVRPDALDQSCIYLCGNSLGPMPKRSQLCVENEINRWSSLAVEGHFNPKGHGWVNQLDDLHPVLADLIGATTSETVCMGTLTSNLHLMMNAFYKPNFTRYKILCEEKAFPSDQYAFSSQALQHGLDPTSTIMELKPRPGEHTLRTEDILKSISEHGDSIALVLFSGVQYYTGQWFAMKEITAAAQSKGCICGWDLAHAIGNVPLSLHDWDVDFAVWCSYKYLNAGPGAIGGLFVHSKWDKVKPPVLAGWWGHKLESRFQMPSTFSAILGAQGWQQSNPSALAAAALQGSLEIFHEAGGIQKLRAKSIDLTGYLATLLQQSRFNLPSDGVGYTIISPTNIDERGSQLSLMIVGGAMEKVFTGLKARGVICDERHPDVIRLSPIPLYNTYEDCLRGVAALEDVFASL